MILEFVKGTQFGISTHFSSHQFDCKCKNAICRTTYVDEEMVTIGLEPLRGLIGQFVITSAFRCTAHNRAEGGKPGSLHLLGKAVDIIPKASISEVLKAANYLTIFRNGGIGRGKNFLHLDARGYPARWEY